MADNELTPASGSPTGLSPSAKRLKWADSLRGLAILAVVVVHSVTSFSAMGWLPYSIFWAGRYGVDLFFAISGFVLYHTYRKLEQQSQNPRRIFVVRRWARLAPVYYFGILLYGYFLSDGGTLSAKGVATNLVFMNGWVPAGANATVPGGWSISAEATFALVFVILAPWISNSRRALALCLISWAVTWQTTGLMGHALAAVAGKASFGSDLEYLPWRHLPTFMTGVLCWHLWYGRVTSAHVVPPWRRVACAVVSLSLFLVIPLDVWPKGDRPLLAGTASALLLYAWSAGPLEGWWSFALGWLGRLSYGIYIFHFAMLNVGKGFAIGLLPIETPSILLFTATCLLTLAFTVPLAWISWVCVEQPVHRWINRITDNNACAKQIVSQRM